MIARAILSITLITILFSLTAESRKFNTQRRRQPESQLEKRVIIQLFGWNWVSIAAECREFIGPAGYGYVQVSPAQEHLTGDNWWTDYQAVSYKLQSKRGTREQFQDMVNSCHAAGVKVIADILLNHMAGVESGTGTAGSNFTHYHYPGIYQRQDFHHCGLPNDDVQRFQNRSDVYNCELGNLADLATETEYVRGRLAEHMNDLLNIGIDGFRVDAAKRVSNILSPVPSSLNSANCLDIPVADLENMFGRLVRRPYMTLEVPFGAGEAIDPSEYVGLGEVQEFRYFKLIRKAFKTEVSGLEALNDNGLWMGSSNANVFVANHDKERNGEALMYKSKKNIYVNAHVFSLAHTYGRPTILSSFKFSKPDAGAPNQGAARCAGNAITADWLCQHRWPAIAGMIGFHNTVGRSELNGWTSPTSQRIAFGRGSAGFVAINNADLKWRANFRTLLRPGRYCDVVSGPLKERDSCSGASFTVADNGTFSATVPAHGSIAIHVNASLSS
ncbi:glycoside hydrolase superfamily [Infundibulicybe gibba]|nr:glycoside hydrolase superfamily [Infundibulicybe gibba]